MNHVWQLNVNVVQNYRDRRYSKYNFDFGGFLWLKKEKSTHLAFVDVLFTLF